MDIIFNISLGVIATFICFVAGVLSRSILTFVVEKKPAHKVWIAKSNEPVEIIITSAPVEHVQEKSGLVYPTEAVAAAEVALFLRDTFQSQTRISASDKFPDDFLQNDLVVIGGPVHNELTRDLLEKLNLENLVDGYSIVSAAGKKYLAQSSSFAGEEKITHDYGLVIRAPNPYNKSKHVTLLIGSKTAGALIAARALVDPMIRPTAKKIHSGKSFYIVAGASVSRNQPGALEIEEVW